MKACGIVAEYNPLHTGHVYQMNKARQISQADCIIVVMSGNFVQRGEPAVIDKYARTSAALKAGADIVVELPVYYALSSAENFAKGALLYSRKRKFLYPGFYDILPGWNLFR